MRAVVIGTGPAGITASETLRHLDPAGSVLALSAEPYPPYSPAAMADHFLTGRENTLYWKGRYALAQIGATELRGTVAAHVDVDNNEVVLDAGTRCPYDGLVLAYSRLHVRLSGADRPGVLDFKSLANAHTLADRVRHGEVRSALVVGHGLIGIELALLLRDLGVDVTVVGRRPWVMPRVLDPVTLAWPRPSWSPAVSGSGWASKPRPSSAQRRSTACCWPMAPSCMPTRCLRRPASSRTPRC